VTHQSSAELAALEQAATRLNDRNAVSRTVPVFDRNEAVPFPGTGERKMTGIPGRPGMQTLIIMIMIIIVIVIVIIIFVYYY